MLRYLSEVLLNFLSFENRNKSSVKLIGKYFPEFDKEKFIFNPGGLKEVDCIELPVDYFKVDNPRGFDISGSTVWVPEQSKEKIKKQLSFVIKSESRNCKFLMLRTPSSGKQQFIIEGSGVRVLSLSWQKTSYRARLVGDSSLVIGEETFIGQARLVMVNSDIRIGAGGLWSDEVIMQATDSHGIIDLATGEMINGGRHSIDIGRHVWIGRRSIVTKNIKIDDGAIVGIGSVVTKDVPQAVAVAGVPARIVKEGVTWTNSPDGISDKERPDIERISNCLRQQTSS